MTRFNTNDRVFHLADPRHIGIIKTICRRTGGDIATIVWEDTGWKSVAVPTSGLRHINSPNLLEIAIECDDSLTARDIICDALGITDRAVADYCLPVTEFWPRYRDQRAKILADWLGHEVRYAAACP